MRHVVLPPTPERAALDKKRSIRDIVFGFQDGILTTLGVLTSLSATTVGAHTILLAGFLTALAGVLSMGIGEYLGGKSEREVVRRVVAEEASEMHRDPLNEHREQVEFLLAEGFSREDAEHFTVCMAKNPDMWLNEMLRTEYGVDPNEVDASPVKPGITMGLAFAVGALLPLAAYIFLSGSAALVLSLGMSAAALFAIGWYAGTMGNIAPWRKGVELVAWGVLLFLVAYFTGKLMPGIPGL